MMAIHAKSNGLLIGGKLIGETENSWVFQAIDNKRPTVVDKNNPKARVFDGEKALDDATAWQDSLRR